jgi:hypothetical protein
MPVGRRLWLALSGLVEKPLAHLVQHENLREQCQSEALPGAARALINTAPDNTAG